jgi:acetylornithine deacetylase/succinyl-diaminopimelate desuccinylase-like protein
MVLRAALAVVLLVSQRTSASSVSDAVSRHLATNRPQILTELVDWLRLPNLATDDAAIRANAARLIAMLERRGIAARLLEAPGSPPAVYGERRTPGATRTVVFYAHYDGQPVVAKDWATPPWEPTFRDRSLEAGGKVLSGIPEALAAGGAARVYARSSSDDKSPIVAMLAALDALDRAGIRPSVNLNFFFEGEEEAGSDHLAGLLRRHRDLLAADLWLFCDGPVHPDRRPQVVFGVRGVMGLEVTVYGPQRPLHSGHYGNWAPNPALLIAELVAGLRSSSGEATIPGFMDRVRPISAADRAALAALPSPDADLRRELGLAATEAGGALLAERILLPAVNVRGIAVGGVGAQAANAIPSEARASFDFRIVPDQQPADVAKAVEARIRALGYHVVTAEPTDAERAAHPKIARLEWATGYAGVRTPLDLPASRAVVAALREAAGDPLYEVPSLGGSLPLAHFVEELPGAPPLIIVPMVNHDNRQHAANENLRLQNLWDGIGLYAHLMARLDALWK